jgi:hypothetical protein
MKKILLSFAMLTSLSMVGMLFFNQGNLYSESGGAPQAGSCTACHGGSNQTSADVSLTVKDSTGAVVTQYITGRKYTVTFGKHGTTPKVGFGISATGGTLVKNTGDVKVKLGTGGSYLTHTSAGTTISGGHAEWSATWTAPATGTVTFQLYINQTNSDGGTTGDDIFSKSLQVTKSVTGLNTLTNDVSFKVYPNPVANNLYVSFNVKYESPIKITMVSLDGKQVVELFNGVETKGMIERSFDISDLAKGIYFINIATTEGNVHQKIMVN